MVKQSVTLDGVFGALSDPVRRHIVERLTRGELTAGAIAAGFSISQPAVSKHLKVLERCGLVKRTIVGREHHLRLAPRAMETAAQWIDRQRAFWNSSFDRLDQLLERTSESEPPHE
ncbi:MAG TPA: metalloregulator ArsR/SmtB family transcription factor [Candidatus Lustribacter sp.]